MGVLENETAIGLREKEMLSEDMCKTVSSTTVQGDKKPATALFH